MIIETITPDQFTLVPWRNGLGNTTQMCVEWPPNASDFHWRLSMAPVQNDGPFSDFTGYQRTLVLIEGNGITLHHGTGQTDRLSHRFDIARFDGAAHTDARLHNGPITDLNVMTQAGICTADVHVLEKRTHLFNAAADWLLLFPWTKA